ncbi:SDR family NAD(P)-dependent oxidoreductase [Alicyclobacillus fastidiosus]|uniref:SDR family NAD(P)-dependent oxidoreductase n=1 Tax=Alicyclobacillus fastidiosus TaxID=392011 RepID=UPI0023EA0E7E|nr:SDR family NAD(P)-dependent oxidoreductase [Alicyclobacillus fastidiosus]GMA60729.1 hypothetical protein GCM10025859_11690 [Alicyclobacillus fastidiosus]
MGKLLNQVAVITGGGSGIGEATAKLFAAEEASVVVADVMQDAAEKIALEISNNGGTQSPYKWMYQEKTVY